jgi:hypothetical protein
LIYAFPEDLVIPGDGFDIDRRVSNCQATGIAKSGKFRASESDFGREGATEKLRESWDFS